VAVRSFDIQSGRRVAFERQREYNRRDLFMGKFNPEKFSQRLQDMNTYLDFIPIEKSKGTEKIQKAYGKSFLDDEIRCIMGQYIPPKWTVNILVLYKEPCCFRYFEDQLNMHHQKWQADHQKQIILKMAGKIPGKPNDG
jgi:hypothetical protein